MSLITPSPYLRDGLLTVVEELRARAEQAAQAQRDADAEVERLRAELADAEDHAKACAAEVDALTTSIQWAQQQAAALSERISPDPARQHADTGLIRETPDPPDGDELPFNVVAAPADVIAALTGGIPAVPDDPPSEPGTLVATHGPGETGPLDPAVTSPDTGLAHPVPNPPTPPAAPAAPPGDGGGRHARPKGPRRTGGWPLIGRRKDEQDGDTDG